MSLNKYSVYKAKNSPKKRGRRIFLIILLLILAVAGFWVYQKFDQVIFLFKKDKYSESEIVVLAFEQEISINEKFSEESLKKIKKTENNLRKLLEANPADAMLLWQLTRLQYYQYLPTLRQHYHRHNDLIFNLYIRKYYFFPELQKELWQKLILDLRKSIALKLPKEHENKAKLLLANLYLWSDLSYWQSAYELTDSLEAPSLQNADGPKNSALNDVLNPALFFNFDKNTLANLIRVIIDSALPNWELLKKIYTEPLLNQIKAIYYLRNGNTPMAFSFLSKNIEEAALQGSVKDEKNTTEKDQTLNNAYYLLADLMEKQKDRRKKLYYFSQMNLEEFIPRQKWFLNDFVYLLQFLGEKKKAQEVLQKYEKLSLTKLVK